jgi:hypothetical protein
VILALRADGVLWRIDANGTTYQTGVQALVQSRTGAGLPVATVLRGGQLQQSFDGLSYSTVDLGGSLTTLAEVRDAAGRQVILALRADGVLWRIDSNGTTYVTNVAAFTLESGGGIAIRPLNGAPAAPLSAATSASGYKFSGSADIVTNPALHVAGEGGRIHVSVNWNLNVPGASSQGAALAAGNAAFAAYLQQLAGWHYGSVDTASVTGSVQFVVPSVSVVGKTVHVSNGNAATAYVTVRLSGASPVPVTVQYATQNGSAVAGVDYAAAGGTLTFAPGETTKTLALSVAAKALPGRTLNFFVSLVGGSTNASVAAPTAAVTIVNDNYAFAFFAYDNEGNVVTSGYFQTAASSLDLAKVFAGNALAVWDQQIGGEGYVYDRTAAQYLPPQ